jgi:hypothetical protein
VGIKTLTSSSSFSKPIKAKDDQSVIDITKIYLNNSNVIRDRSNSRSVKRTLTPKVKKSKKIIVMPIEEKTEEDFEKE